MSVCAQVSKYMAAQYHVNKSSFSRKFTLNGIQISNKSYQQIQKTPRNAYNIVLFTYTRYYTFFEAVNFNSAKVDYTVKLKCHMKYTHLCMTPHSVESGSAGLTFIQLNFLILITYQNHKKKKKKVD